MTINRGSASEENPAERFASVLETHARAASQWKDRVFSAGSQIFDPDMELPSLFVLKAGLAKLYYPAPEGDEWTKSYLLDHGVFGPSAVSGSTVKFGAKAIETCRLGTVSLAWLDSHLPESTELSLALGRFERWLFERKRQKEEDFLCLSVEQRYVRFLESDPDLAARLEQKEIASYLRITPVALSRIRRRLRQRGLLAVA